MGFLSVAEEIKAARTRRNSSRVWGIQEETAERERASERGGEGRERERDGGGSESDGRKGERERVEKKNIHRNR